MCEELKPRSGSEGAGLPGAAPERLSTVAAKAWLCVASATFCYLGGGCRESCTASCRCVRASRRPPTRCADRSPKAGSIGSASRASGPAAPPGGATAAWRSSSEIPNLQFREGREKGTCRECSPAGLRASPSSGVFPLFDTLTYSNHRLVLCATWRGGGVLCSFSSLTEPTRPAWTAVRRGAQSPRSASDFSPMAPRPTASGRKCVRMRLAQPLHSVPISTLRWTGCGPRATRRRRPQFVHIPTPRSRSSSPRSPKRSPRPCATPRKHCMVKVPPWQCPSSAPVPPQAAPGGSGQLDTPRERSSHWKPSHCLGCSS